MPRCLLAGLLALLPALLSLLPPLCHRVAVSTFRRKAKHRIVAPLRALRLAVPHLAFMLTTRRPMHARMSSLQTGMLMYARALRRPMTMMTMMTTVIPMTLSAKSSALHSGSHHLSTDLTFGAVDSNVDLACTHLLSPPSPPLCSFFCCCWGALLRSRSFHYHNHLFPLLVAIL